MVWLTPEFQVSPPAGEIIVIIGSVETVVVLLTGGVDVWPTHPATNIVDKSNNTSFFIENIMNS
jgi:hypothetical protein